MMDEGYIKFKCRWIESEPILFEGFSDINGWREKLYQYGLIGIYPNKIGFGNVSIRAGESKQFWITGSGTGGLAILDVNHYSLVEEYSFQTNSLTCRGPVQASSESLTHAAVYLAASEINAVIHVHNLDGWKKLLGRIPTTSDKVAFGTPEMAGEIIRLFRETDLLQRRILIMAGHREGIIAFGRNLDEAGKILLEQLYIG